MSIDGVVRSLGGVASLEQLRSRGFGRADVLDARRAGLLIAVRRAWCAVPDADAQLVQAVRMRGQLTCISATRAMGIWTLDDGRLHVAVPGNGSRLNPRVPGAPAATADPAVTLHWRGRTRAPQLARQPLGDILLHVVECQPPALALAVLDACLHERRCSVRWLVARLQASARGRALAPLLDAGAGSGLESIARHGFRAAGLAVRTQVDVPGLGPRDFLIGDRLWVEIDGRAFHTRVQDFPRDRRIDRELQRAGGTVLRFLPEDVLHHWPRTLETVLDFVRRDRHRRR
ncbi:DUF559 domain-containing protein [Agrococcus jenensis]|uniref:Uncharacterized protein DUF559 n=1 Tax=Agrococcus jenensis TaxID=46353 RepID=A0A3N2APN7_9MICO|nr:DUF559 domain-containing protein [Agrococcus jenensis]ROR64936.1 uncharacterized protein DUF559 [Agrococcus jenensis]